MICLVTDRRRLLAVGRADADGPDPWRACLAVQVRHAVAAGVDLIHLRERDLEAGALASLVTQLLAITAGSSTRLVVSDRVDIALACGADGVHLRGDSIPAAAARRLAPDGFLVGRSVHSRSVRRSPRSPIPQLDDERAAYSWTVQPQVCRSGSQHRPGETTERLVR